MKIFLYDQTKHFPEHLRSLSSKSVMAYKKEKLVEKVTMEVVDVDFSRMSSKFLFDYNIFPDNILTHYTQWSEERRDIRPNDTVVQQVFMPPLKSFSQKLVFGVRIKEVINEPDRIGFSYETLEGHVEKGMSTFALERSKVGKTIFKVHTFSAPSNVLLRCIGPVFAIPYQTYCTRQAVENVKRQLMEQFEF